MDEDLGVVGAVGAPSAVGLSFDPEAVVDLGVVAFAEQRGVLQAGLAAVDPVDRWWTSHQWVGASQPANTQCRSRSLDGPAQVGWDDPVAAALVQRLAVGADDDPGDAAVAGQPAGPGGGDRRRRSRSSPRRGRWPGRPGRSSGMVTTTCGLTVRRIGRSPAARVMSANCTRASPSCWARVRRSPAGRSACTHRLQHGLDLLPADGVELEPAGHAAVGVLGDASATGPRWGRVRGRRGRAGPGSGAPPGASSACGRVGGDVGQRARRPRRGRCPARRRRPGVRGGDRGDDGDLLGGDHPVGAAGGDRRQLLEGPAVADELPGRGRARVAVPAQPGAPSSSARRARGPARVGDRGRCGPARRRSGSGPAPAPRSGPAAAAAEQARAGRRRRGRRGRTAARPRHLPRLRSGVRSSTATRASGRANPQVRRLSTDS